MSDTCLRVVVRGKVQGAFYRNWTVETAGRLGVSGWVRNLTDGTVEALLCGGEEAVEGMIAKMESGPGRAWVEGIDRFPHNGVAPNGFRKRDTAAPDRD